MRKNSSRLRILSIFLTLLLGLPQNIFSQSAGPQNISPEEKPRPVIALGDSDKPEPKPQRVPPFEDRGPLSLPTETAQDRRAQASHIPSERKAQLYRVVDSVRVRFEALETRFEKAMKEKRELESEALKLKEMLEGRKTGMIETRQAMAPHDQVLMTLNLIVEDIEEGAALEDSGLEKAGMDRLQDYLERDKPAKKAEMMLEEKIQQAELRLEKLPEIIEEKKEKVEKRSKEWDAKIIRVMEESSNLMEVSGKSESENGFANQVWPEYSGNQNVLLPWSEEFWVEKKRYPAKIAGLDLKIEFRNGKMDPGVRSTLTVLKKIREKRPDEEVVLLHPPQPLTRIGGYSVSHEGFAHFFAARENNEKEFDDFLLYRTEESEEDSSEPVIKEEASFSIYDAKDAYKADLNQDGILSEEDVTLALEETREEGTRPGESRDVVADLNEDGRVDLKDTLIVTAYVHSGPELYERKRLSDFAEKAMTAQKDFLMSLPRVWREVRNFDLDLQGEKMEILNGRGQWDDYLNNLLAYAQLIKTAAEAMETGDAQLVRKRHPDFFREDGELREELVGIIEQAGLAPLPNVPVFEKFDSRIPLEKLRERVRFLKEILGENPDELFQERLKESVRAQDSVLESLTAVKEVVRLQLEGNVRFRDSQGWVNASDVWDLVAEASRTE